MEQLISEIEAFAARRGIAPQTVVRYAVGQKPDDWRRWKSGKSSCSLRTAEKIREYIATHSEVSP